MNLTGPVTLIYRGSGEDVTNQANQQGGSVKIGLRNLFNLLHCIPNLLHRKRHLEPNCACHITIVEIA